jgi:predicted XRE-type DNA-binding protein
MSEKLKIVRGSGNVFLDIGFSPDEAQNLHLRSAVMSKIERLVRFNELTQKECTAHTRGIRAR